MLSPVFGPPRHWPSQDLIGFSEEFDAALALEAYRAGVFPMPIDDYSADMGWWSPIRRGVMNPHELHVTRSLRKSAKRYRTTVDRAFGQVMDACADPGRKGAWIDERIRDAYTTLHQLGHVHSVEVWGADGRLVGGLYGVHQGALFAGESMFHHPELGRDASKVALLRLVVELLGRGITLLDVQWLTDHLGSLGAYEIPRQAYLRRLSEALERPTHEWAASQGAVLTGAELLARWDSLSRGGTHA
ncbi:leucyl/phenylalanyl-tRNA--protein transferase [Tessaracoccus caeni]|uniref:leucyl/phenylalanyl-tRNA--protein transferase n=1 Tax=Tessaracoccus caeni TaxID=3031239 RepID=UPI0023DB2584|nr:leucyl/phenylalanyl-tRNA--protein transferase [Tessaracoccus caeni]MDF1489922.1 leucyl/phenylalanyl-tRNA--protein transferase [Tessaracoccus caeni]